MVRLKLKSTLSSREISIAWLLRSFYVWQDQRQRNWHVKCENPNCIIEFEPRPRKRFHSRNCQMRTYMFPRNKANRLANPRQAIRDRAKQTAKNRNIEFELTVEDIPEIPEFCPVFPWVKLEHRTGKGRKGNFPNSPSIDRIDSSKGYVRGNIRIISLRANMLKSSDGTAREYEALIQDCKARSSRVTSDC